MPAEPSLKKGNETAPPAPKDKSFRPPYSFRHPVVDGETWETVAARYGLTTRDLIWSNFETDSPTEINWYLHHFIGCDLPTADRYNWRFSSTARNNLTVDSPRRGIVFVVPNWPVVLAKAREATRALVKDWFGRTRITQAAVIGSALKIKASTVVSQSGHKPFFQMDLEKAGMPTVLSAAITEELWDALGVWTGLINDVQEKAFPGFEFSINPVPRIPAVPFALLDSPTNAGMPSAFFFKQKILMRLGDETAAADSAMTTYTLWFDRAFRQMRVLARARGVFGTGVAMVPPSRPGEMPGTQKGVVHGTATAEFGFLTGVELPD